MLHLQQKHIKTIYNEMYIKSYIEYSTSFHREFLPYRCYIVAVSPASDVSFVEYNAEIIPHKILEKKFVLPNEKR